MWRMVIVGAVSCGPGLKQSTTEPTSKPTDPATIGARVVAPQSIAASRTSGSNLIVPDAADMDRLSGQGARAAGRFQLCLDVTGTPSHVDVVDTTGLPNYDAKIVAQMKTWRYRPIVLDGKPTAVCTWIMFVYKQS